MAKARGQLTARTVRRSLKRIIAEAEDFSELIRRSRIDPSGTIADHLHNGICATLRDLDEAGIKIW